MRLLLLCFFVSAATPALAAALTTSGSATETARSEAQSKSNGDVIWALVSNQPVDSRIQAQVEELASQHGASVTAFQSLVQAHKRLPAITIELVKEDDPRA